MKTLRDRSIPVGRVAALMMPAPTERHVYYTYEPPVTNTQCPVT